MSVIQLKVHEYLGITIDYTVHGQVRISMFSYIEEILTAFVKAYLKGKGLNSSTTPNNIFVVYKYFKKLDQVKVVESHNLVANTLSFTKRSIPDTHTSIAFLKTRVRSPDKDNWAKLVHLMK